MMSENRDTGRSVQTYAMLALAILLFVFSLAQTADVMAIGDRTSGEVAATVTQAQSQATATQSAVQPSQAYPSMVGGC